MGKLRLIIQPAYLRLGMQSLQSRPCCSRTEALKLPESHQCVDKRRDSACVPEQKLLEFNVSHSLRATNGVKSWPASTL